MGTRGSETPALYDSSALIDKVSVCRGCKSGADAEERVEGGGRVAPSVPAEDEFVEVAVQMGAAQAVEGPERPAFEVGEHAMDPLQDDMGGHFPDDLRFMVVIGQTDISAPTIGDHPRARRGYFGDEGMEAGGGEILDRRHADASRLALARQFHGAGDEHLADGASPASAGWWIGFSAQGDLGFVGLDQVLKQITIGRHHGAAEPLQQEPGGLVTAKAKLGLQLQRRDAIGVAGHDVDGRKPRLQWQMAAVHDRAGRHGSLLAAGRALPSRALALQRPALCAAAGRTNETPWPASFRQIACAHRLVRKPFLERGAGHRAIVYPAARHMRTLREHRGVVKPKHHIWEYRTKRDKPLVINVPFYNKSELVH